MRVDSALVPPGMIASAKMYSLFIHNGNFYIICTGPGPASIVDYTQGLLKMRQARDGLKNLAETLVVNSYLKKIQAVEAQITISNLDSYALQKGNIVFPLSDVLSFTVEIKQAYIKLIVITAKKKFKFDVTVLEKERITEMAAAFKA